jgi:hypothetical protein
VGEALIMKAFGMGKILMQTQIRLPVETLKWIVLDCITMEEEITDIQFTASLMPIETIKVIRIIQWLRVILSNYGIRSHQELLSPVKVVTRPAQNASQSIFSLKRKSQLQVGLLSLLKQ